MALACGFDTAGSGGGPVDLGSDSAATTQSDGSTTRATSVTSATTQPPDDDDGPTPTTGVSTNGTGPVTTDGESSESSTGPPPPPPKECDGGGFCLPEVPAPWSGPVLWDIFDPGGTPVACPGGVAPALEAHRGPMGNAAVCDCSCDSAAASCDVDYEFHSNGSCGDEIESGLVGPTCTTISLPASPNTGRGGAPVASGDCIPNPAAPSIEPPFWARDVLVCDSPEGAACAVGDVEAGTCHAVPEKAFENEFCIYQAGLHPCPEGGLFIGRSVVFFGFADDRGCSPCACGAPMLDACPGDLHWYDDTDCTSGDQTAADGNCVDGPNSMTFGARYVGDLPSVSCMQPEVPPTGEVAGDGPTTVCCSGPAR